MEYKEIIKLLKAERETVEKKYNDKKESEKKAKIEAILKAKEEMLKTLEATETLGLWRIYGYLEDNPMLKPQFEPYAHRFSISLDGDKRFIFSQKREFGLGFVGGRFEDFNESYLEKNKAIDDIYEYVLNVFKPWFYDKVDEFIKKYNATTEAMKKDLE